MYCKDCGELLTTTNEPDEPTVWYCPTCDVSWTYEQHIDLIKDLLDRIKVLEKELGI